MVWIFRRFAKPEYLFRPSQVFSRLARAREAGIPEAAVVRLPWGYPLAVAPRETIGGGIWRLGLHELLVSEVLWRLIDPGDRVADVGANSGHFTSLMAARTGSSGGIWAFEPHPEMRARLEGNLRRWNGLAGADRVRIFSCALSDEAGSAQLCLPPLFEKNTGTAFLHDGNHTAPVPGTITVETRRLDAVIAQEGAPSVIKIDVEGHESRVLAGAGDLVARRGIRDIIFEEHAAYPAASVLLLERHGYTIFKLRRSLLRPLLAPRQSRRDPRSWESENYLATIDPARACSRMKPRGWQCLSGRAAKAA
jgi:FkbM family methyltransferase